MKKIFFIALLSQIFACVPTAPEKTVKPKEEAAPAQTEVSLEIDASGGEVVVNDSSCTQRCLFEFLSGTVVTLKATADQGFQFSSFSIPSCSDSTCEFSISEDLSLESIFQRKASFSFKLKFISVGDGELLVNGETCSSPCEKEFLLNEQVSLSTRANEGSIFDFFQGACEGFNSCDILMNQELEVVANFKTIPDNSKTLTINKNDGDGLIYVDGSPCLDFPCVTKFNANSLVTVKVEDTVNWAFESLGSPCGVEKICEFLIDADLNLLAKFKELPLPPLMYTLTVNPNIGGSVLVNGQVCATPCKKTLAAGTEVSVTTSPNENYELLSFQGHCSGTTCALKMDSDKTVAVNFKQIAIANIDIKLAWDAVEKADGYKIYFGDTSGNYNGKCANGGISPVQIDKATLANASLPTTTLKLLGSIRKCYFSVSSYNRVGEGKKSSEIIYSK